MADHNNKDNTNSDKLYPSLDASGGVCKPRIPKQQDGLFHIIVERKPRTLH